MDAAFREFLDRGYAATSLDDIAGAAGVSRQTVYNHFDDKETLFLAVVDEALRAQLDEMQAATEGFPDPPIDVEDYLIGVGRQMVATFLDPRAEALRTLVQSEVPRHPGLLALWQERSRTPVWTTLIGNIARLGHAGLLDLDDPARSTGQFVTLVTGAGWQMTNLGTFATGAAIDPAHLDTTLQANVRLFIRAHTTPRNKASSRRSTRPASQ